MIDIKSMIPVATKYVTIVLMIIIAFYLGMYVEQNNILITAYFTGHIDTPTGQNLCEAALDKNNAPYWDCSKKIEVIPGLIVSQ